MKHEVRTEAGFTLVESLVAIVVLSFGLIAVTNLLLVAATSNTVATHSSAATMAAVQTMEEIKAVPYTTLPAVGVGATVGDITADATGPSVTNLPLYSRFVDTPGVGRVRVRWQMRGINANLRFITVRAESIGALAGARSRAEFTTFRACTSAGCP